MDKKKLLMISTDRLIFSEGSAVGARLAKSASDWKEVHIIVFSGKDHVERSLGSNCFVYPTRSWTKFLYPLDAIRLGKFIIERRGIDEISCQDTSLTAMAGLSLKKKFNLPVELGIHGDISSPHFTLNIVNRIRKAMALSYIPKADKIRVVSEKLRSYVVDTLGVDSEKVYVKPIPVDTEAIVAAPIVVDLKKKYQSYSKIILVSARLEKEKNVGLAVDIMESLAKKDKSLGMVIVGSGSEGKKLESKVKKLGLDNQIVFEPWLRQDVLFSYYKTADIFLNTSLFEGYGMALVEAKAANCLVVSTDVGVASQIGCVIIPFEKEKATDIVMQELNKK